MGSNLFVKVSALVLGGIILAIIFFEPSLPTIPSKANETPDYAFENVTITHVDDGKIVWEIVSEKAKMFEDRQQIFFTDMAGRIYPKETQDPLYFKSPSSNLLTDTATLEMDNAHSTFVVNQDDVTLLADHLTWDAELAILDGNGNVRITATDLQIQSDHFYSKIPIRFLRMDGNASAEIID